MSSGYDDDFAGRGACFMHLTSFGLISLKGSVTKPEPGLGFADYQIAMANYSASVALKSRLGKEQQTASSPDTPETPANDAVKHKQVLRHPPRSAASALVRKFRG